MPEDLHMVYPECEPKNTVKPSENDDKTKAEVIKTTEVSVNKDSKIYRVLRFTTLKSQRKIVL